MDKEDSKVEEVKNWPIPKTIQDVLAFLGLAGFYLRFVHNLQKLLGPSLQPVACLQPGCSQAQWSAVVDSSTR